MPMPMIDRRTLVHILVLAACALPLRAWAQASPQAEALFRSGKQLMKEGKLDEACAAFEGSERSEHNIATVMSLADCREKNHQLASAWALFLQADSQTRSDPKQAALNTTAKKRALALEPRLSYLTVNVADEARVKDLVVTRDGVVVDSAEWNRAIPVDGGSHVIAGKAPGHESWSTTVTVEPERGKGSVEVPKFKELPKLVHVEGETPAQGGPGGVVERPNLFTPRRKIAVGVAAGGVVLAGIGIGLGASATSLRNEAVATCPPASCSPSAAAAAQDKNDQARKRALMANVGFGLAGGAIAAGVVLWVIGKPGSSITVVPEVDDESAGASIVGRF